MSHKQFKNQITNPQKLSRNTNTIAIDQATTVLELFDEPCQNIQTDPDETSTC